MIVGIISDTHNRVAVLPQIFDRLNSVSVGMLVHAGDWTSVDTLCLCADFATSHKIQLIGVLGNNDQPDELMAAALTYGSNVAVGDVMRLTIQHQNVTIYHGHHKPTLKLLLREAPDVLIRGHTHNPLIEQIDHTLVINPGSTAFSIPRTRDYYPTFATYDTQARIAQLVQLK